MEETNTAFQKCPLVTAILGLLCSQVLEDFSSRTRLRSSQSFRPDSVWYFAVNMGILIPVLMLVLAFT